MIPKIAVYAICKDEAANVSAFLANVKHADQVVLLDTGSSDETPQLIVSESKKLGVNVTYDEVLVDPFSFSIARNMAMNLVEKDIEYMLFLDLDERLSDGWKDKLCSALQSVADQVSKPTSVNLEMIFSRDDQGNPVHVYEQMKVHTRDYKWMYSCHEVLVENNPKATFLTCRCKDVKVTHLKDESKPRSSYLSMLENDVGSIGDQRSLYYYGRELYYNERYEDAIVLMTAAVESKKAWKAQTAMSYAIMADCYAALGQQELVIPSLYNAALLNPMHPDHWYDLGFFYYEIGQYHLAIGYMTRAILLAQEGNRTTDYVITDLSKVGWKAHDVLATCYYQLNLISNYINHCATAYKLNPTDSRILSNFNDMVQTYGIKEDENDLSES